MAYDVLTISKGGKGRLRSAAKACEGFGRRVQWSVFVCRLTPLELKRLRAKLLDILDIRTDRLLIVPIRAGREDDTEELGPLIERDAPTVLEV